jgi:hypothetical protein
MAPAAYLPPWTVRQGWTRGATVTDAHNGHFVQSDVGSLETVRRLEIVHAAMTALPPGGPALHTLMRIKPQLAAERRCGPGAVHSADFGGLAAHLLFVRTHDINRSRALLTQLGGKPVGWRTVDGAEVVQLLVLSEISQEPLLPLPGAELHAGGRGHGAMFARQGDGRGRALLHRLLMRAGAHNDRDGGDGGASVHRLRGRPGVAQSQQRRRGWRQAGGEPGL